MNLRSLKARNFRLLEDFEIEFCSDVTVLIGANNAGKSNVVDALLLFKHATEGQLANALARRDGFGRVVSRHRIDRNVELAISLFHPEHQDIAYVVRFSQTTIDDEVVTMLGRDWRSGQRVHDYLYVTRQQELFILRDYFLGIVHVDPFRQVEFQYQIAPTRMVDARGANLAQVLHYHYNNDRERFDQYETIVRKVLPEIEMIETPILPPPNVTVSLKLAGDSEKYNLWQISSGLKNALVLLSATHFSPPGSLVIIEEPENHLHPESQKALCTVIREAATGENKQFILTTHSEVILGQFGEDKAIFVDKDEGKAKAIPLSKAEPYQVWQRLGIESTDFLQILGKQSQVIAILEGPDDYQALEPLWEHYQISDKVLARSAGGGGWREIVDSAASLRESLVRFRIPSTVFVLLDRDSEGNEKSDHLRNRGFTQQASHVLSEKEIESYLLLPTALSTISAKPIDEVRRVIGQTTGQGKEKLNRVLRTLGIEGTPRNVIVRNALRTNPDEVSPEMKEIPNKVRRMLGLPSH